MWKKVRKAIYWTVGLFVVTIAGVVGKQIGGDLARPSKAETLSKVVAQAAEKLNALAPKKIDEITTLVRAEALQGGKLATYYALENYDSYAKDFSLSLARSSITKSVCSKQGPPSKSPLALGMTHVYIYTKENGTEIGRFEVSKKDCPQIR